MGNIAAVKHDIPEPTEQYDIDVAIRGRSDLPNPHAVNSSGQYVDSTKTIRESCGCSEANVLDNNHNVCVVQPHSRPDGDNGIDGFDPLAHMSMEFTVQSAIDNLKSINNKKVDLPIAVLEMLKESLTKGDR